MPIRRSSSMPLALAVVLATAGLMGVPALGASMNMGSQPENDAAALTALERHNLLAAGVDLRAAIASHHEPAAARAYARAALKLVTAHRGARARVPAEKGAAVEHLTYALGALRAHDLVTAHGHLMEAVKLPIDAKAAHAALAAIKKQDAAGALKAVQSGLKALHA